MLIEVPPKYAVSQVVGLALSKMECNVSFPQH
jgi:hypothetical protein